MFELTTNQILSYSNLNVSTNVTSTQNINVNPVSYILIRSDSLTQSQNFESIIQRDVVSDIICKIQLTTQPGTYILYNGDLNLDITLTNKIIDTVSLYLSTNKDYQLSLNNLDWSCRLTIEEVDNGLAHDLSINSVDPENLKQINDLTNQRETLINQINSHRHKLISKINLASTDE